MRHHRIQEICTVYCSAALFAMAVYGAFYGSPFIYFISGVVIAAILFWLRKRHRIVYGVAEVIAGLFTLSQSSRIGRGAFSSGFNEAFEPYQWQLVLIATLGAIYIIIRGLDNIDEGWHQ
jgi:hypothetical protein